MQLPSTDLNNADFSSADMRQCDLSKSNLQKANFTGAQLQGDATHRAAFLTEANLENANFTNANLTGTNLAGVFLWGDQATLSGATVINTDFSNAYLVALRFTDIADNQCQGAIFDHSCLINASFNHTKAGVSTGKASSFVKACLQGADFRDAKLDGVDLTSAGVAQSSGTFPVTLPSVPVTLPITYATATLGIEAATSNLSECPNGQPGPCTVAQQTAPDAPTQWPVQSAVNRLSLGALGGSSEVTSQSARAPQRAEESGMAWSEPRFIEFLRRCFRRGG